nr:hydrolase 2, exosortase A system-associated [uncultured Roseateles sp.]
MTTQSFFMPATSGQRLCILHPAAGGRPRGQIVYLHPFAEEMNKTRRMAALQSRMLAQAGYAVLQIDLLGCGDSSGDHGDASWQAWMDDVQRACQWLKARGDAPLWLWGLRAGALLAIEAARAHQIECHFLLWQPSTSGKQMLQQFLRLKLAGELLDGGAKGAMEAMRQELAAGKTIEVAGYGLSPALAQGLQSATLEPPSGRSARLEWLDLSTRADAKLSPASAQALDRWTQAGWQARGQLVEGPSFWQTSEIEEAPQLLDASLGALIGARTP